MGNQVFWRRKKWFLPGDTVLKVALWINKQRREANVQRKSKGRCFKMLAPRMWLTWWGCAWRCGLHADQPSGADHPPPPIGSNGSKKEERRKSWNRIYQQLHTSNSYGWIHSAYRCTCTYFYAWCERSEILQIHCHLVIDTGCCIIW